MMQKVSDLHDLRIVESGKPLDSHNTSSGCVEVVFTGIKERLIKEIRSHRVVVGCVAWMTDPEIIAVLRRKRNRVSIIVQKEDFLRPDMHQTSMRCKKGMYKLYSSLGSIWRGNYPVLNGLSFGGDTYSEAVRCVGNHNSERSPAFPRMHNKFLVFCKCEKDPDNEWEYFELSPVKVWTGSFNFSKNANASFENAVIISDAKIAEAYYKEYAQIFALSEPLDWESEWCEPEYREGS